MLTSIALSVGLIIADALPAEFQQTAVEPISATAIVRELNTRLKSERAAHQREQIAELRVGHALPVKAMLDIYKSRVANIEKKTQQIATQIVTFEGASNRLGGALDRIQKARTADKAARTTDALNAFAKEGLAGPLKQILEGPPKKESIEAMNQLLADVAREVVTQYGLSAELSQMLIQQRRLLAECQIAVDRERKLDGLNMAIFALDGALRVVGTNPATK
jgi:hypothetical protein